MKDILHLNMYLITNLLTVYTVFKFFKIFFDEEKYQKYKISGYLLYYIITTSVYLFCHNSLLTLVANIICMFVITNLYKSSLSNPKDTMDFNNSISMWNRTTFFTPR